MELDYLDTLNPSQREAVENVAGPSMIIAGAGSGKTRVLTYRIAHLMKAHGVHPFNILALTFTNKAAKEMKERIERVVGSEARYLWMGTFHAMFLRVLRAEAGLLGYSTQLSVYDTDDAKGLIKQIIKAFGLDDKVYKPNVVYNRISNAKNRLISWQAYRDNPIYLEDDTNYGKPDIGRIYQEYAQRCFKADAMDFDDLLFNMHVLFRDHPQALEKYQERFRYIMVDEFQDTNIAQYVITKKLSGEHKNICVVGDDAQSIYAFRGANIQNILNFEKDYPGLKTTRLEQNYRSSDTIVQAANTLIAKNKSQLKKHVWTDNSAGELIELMQAATDNEEGKLVAHKIFETKANHQGKNADFAILYRTNSQSRALEEALRGNNIHYKILGGLSFYQRKEIKDLLAYIRYTVNSKDEQALRRIINAPKRGIGAGSVEKIITATAERNSDLWTTLRDARSLVSARIADAIGDFVDLIKSFRLAVAKKDAFEAASHIAKHSGLLKELYEDKTVEGKARYENVQEFLNGVKEYVENPENEDTSMAAFLQEIALLTDADLQAEGDDQNFVSLMTIHGAKGLEFKHVFVVGLEEELFPSPMAASQEDLEEERRLFYVAITRAEQRLYLSYAHTRYRFGKLTHGKPSPFLREIDAAFIQAQAQQSQAIGYAQPPQRRNFTPATRLTPPKPSPHQQLHKPSPHFTPDNNQDLTQGMKVEHPKFGFGMISEIKQDGDKRKAHIRFEKAGDKVLLLSFAKLMIIH